MHEVKIDPTLCRMIEVYRYVGLWRNENESDLRSSCVRILYFLQYIGFSIYLLMGAYHGYLHKNVSQITFLFEAQITVLILTVKLAYLLWRKDDILRFLYDPLMTHCTKDSGDSVEVNNKIEKVALFYRVYTFIVIIATLFEVFLPLPVFTSDGKMLPGFIHFNLQSDYETVFYWMVYIYGSVSVVLSAFYIFFMLFIWYIMYNYAIEYKLLGHRIRSIDGTTTQDTYHHQLIHLIRAHGTLFDTIDQFRSRFSALFFVEITTGAISICVATYNLAYNTADNVFQMAVYVALLQYAFFEIFLIMYLANEITIESDKLSYCLFESNWTEQSALSRKCVVILAEMLRRPQRLVIFSFPMNLEKLTSIVKGAYSMFNVLQSFK